MSTESSHTSHMRTMAISVRAWKRVQGIMGCIYDREMIIEGLEFVEVEITRALLGL